MSADWPVNSWKAPSPYGSAGMAEQLPTKATREGASY